MVGTHSPGGVSRVARALALLLAGGVLLSACATHPKPGASEAGSVAPSAPPETSPLTGMPVTSATETSPALSAKIGNDAEARPQRGLDQADIVFEELVEGGLTRYVGVWQSRIPKEIGPLRSIRPMDPDIVSPFGGLVAYSGGQQIFVDMMRAAPVKNYVHGDANADPFMYRSKDKPAPHNVILRAQDLLKKEAALAPPRPQFDHSDGPESATAALSGVPVASIHTTFSAFRKQSWDWAEAGGSFVRSQQGHPDLAADGKPLSAINVVSLRVEISHQYPDVPKTELIGSGVGQVATAGKTIAVSWAKASATEPIRLTAEDGSAVLLAPGNTWVELVPLVPGADITVQ
ncbi:DUF3048 domain-containing protein [Mycetocola tolaasinivorans]|uniref:DUF3048 domain-containing protein n=1 Tax=Mycetocola tolaasinivorans TaxID=76635 RepID=A0A3L7AAF5_9MICO|nr:DUF3048 domain-containing protein [Mycetocola tolaasinivorans]RLP77446.1 DUF3048 domain-containing protein [Mycetocola tolaasinivorans]